MSNPTAIQHPVARETAARCLACLICCATVALPGAVSASEVKVSVGAGYFAEDFSSGSSGTLTQTAATGVVSQVADSAYLGSGGRAVASARLGVLESAATAGASRGNINNGYASQGQSRADASWYDIVTIADAGLSGTGLASVRFFIDAPLGNVTNDGTAGVGGSFSGTAAADFGMRVNGVLFTFNTQAALTNLGTDQRYTFTRVNGVDITSGLGGYWDLTVPITFGQAFGIEAVLTTTASTLAGANSSVNSFANFGHSIYWGGIPFITLASGYTTTAYSALGTAAYDWKVSAAPVPEPSSTWLLLLGLGAMARRLAFRRKAGTAGLTTVLRVGCQPVSNAQKVIGA